MEGYSLSDGIGYPVKRCGAGDARRVLSDVLRACAAMPAGPGPSLVLFPSETEPGVSFSQEETFRLSGLLAPLYQALASAVARRAGARYATPREASAVLARCAVVPIVYCFMDRLLRLDRLVAARGSARPAVLRCESPGPAQDVHGYIAAASLSTRFNQSLLCDLAPVWGLPIAEGDFREPAPPAAAGPGPVNFNCRRLGSGGVYWLRKAANKLACAVLHRFNGGVPTLSMAYADIPLREAFFFVRLLREMPSEWPLQVAAPDPMARADILGGAVGECAGALELFLTEAGVADADVRSRAREAFDRHLQRFYPSLLLEGAGANLDFCLRELGAQRRRVLFFTAIGSTREAFMVAAARELGFETVGCQHAGSYGYLEDFADAEELEYPFAKRFITWGWTDLPDHLACKSVRAAPLPSPWLSERARYWSGALPLLPPPAQRPYDLLFMSSRCRTFPRAPAGGFEARLDTLACFADMVRDLASRAAAAGVDILHKPYTRLTTDLIKGILADMRRLGGTHYAEWGRFDKGMTPELLSQARFVLWGQPGTGFAECLVCGIPTLLLWPRFDSRETPGAAGVFRALEEAGVVHRSVESLIAETLRGRSDPASWLAEPARREAIAEFCRKFAWADPSWARKWRGFLCELGACDDDKKGETL